MTAVAAQVIVAPGQTFMLPPLPRLWLRHAPCMLVVFVYECNLRIE